MGSFSILNTIDDQQIWSGIGGHFDSLGQIIHEFIDNSISNIEANSNQTNSTILLTLEKIVKEGGQYVKITIEDSGTGIKNIDEAFRLGGTDAGESPRNEHGFGLKHALASANPGNDMWSIYTRTQDDMSENVYKKISAPYKTNGFEGEKINGSTWPGQNNSSGTIIEFTCTWELYRSIVKGIPGSFTNFKSIADVLCEELGFTYAGVLNGTVVIKMIIKDNSKSTEIYNVGVVTPDWEEIYPSSVPTIRLLGIEKYDLGFGKVEIKYCMGKITRKSDRNTQFDNSGTKKYYKMNMSSSGVEIRINGRLLAYNLFKEIWNIEKHNSYNALLITIDIVSDDLNALPKTKTSKNGFRQGDIRLENLYTWIKAKMKEPQKDLRNSTSERELFEEIKNKKIAHSGLIINEISTETWLFTAGEGLKNKVRCDLYISLKAIGSDPAKIEVYEGKIGTSSIKDIYQLKMYWDGLVYDGIQPDEGILVAHEHRSDISSIVDYINSMTDKNGKNYNFKFEYWENLLV